MDELEFKASYEAEIPALAYWGNFVNNQVIETINQKRDGRNWADSLLKIPATPRVKNISSIISKAFYRQEKKYIDPLTQITDKVGIRYVVLLSSEIKIIAEIIENNPYWIASKDKDFEKDRQVSPEHFTYQSVHYVVRNKDEIALANFTIPTGMACEIQIRTLLQHAYSELTHDRVYKPKTNAKPEVKRMVARSMALIETTDEIFEKVNMTIRSDRMDTFLEELTSLYRRITLPDFEEKLNIFILDAFNDAIETVSITDVEEFLANNKHIEEIIKRKYSSILLYRQPVVLFILYMIEKQRVKSRSLWPLPDSELRPFYVDLGFSFE